LNGLHLYYKTLEGAPSQIIDIHVPHCLPVVPADFDDDCDVDLSDVDAYEACAFGPDLPLDPNCVNRDLDDDADADLSELSVLQRCFSGDGIAGDPDCAN